MLTRRDFLRMVLGALPLAFLPGAERAFAYAGMKEGDSGPERFDIVQLRYRGGDWDPDPAAAALWSREMRLRTSVGASRTRRDLPLMSPDLFSHPMLYLTGHYEFDPFSDEEIARLRNYLDYGGLLVADDCAGHPGFDFDKALRREIGRLYPEKTLAKLPREHAVLRSFYLIRTLGGRRLVSPYLEGLDIGGRTAVIYCQNDIGCAMEQDEAGNWIHPCLPGGGEAAAAGLPAGGEHRHVRTLPGLQERQDPPPLPAPAHLNPASPDHVQRYH